MLGRMQRVLRHGKLPGSTPPCFHEFGTSHSAQPLRRCPADAFRMAFALPTCDLVEKRIPADAALASAAFAAGSQQTRKRRGSVHDDSAVEGARLTSCKRKTML